MLQIRKFREAQGMTQIELAKRLDVTQGVVSQWENDSVKPRTDKLVALSSALHCTVDELLDADTGSEGVTGE